MQLLIGHRAATEPNCRVTATITINSSMVTLVGCVWVSFGVAQCRHFGVCWVCPIAASVGCRAAIDVIDDCRRFCTRLADPNRSLLCEPPLVKQLSPPSSTRTPPSQRSFRRVFCDRAEICSGAVRRCVPSGYSTTLSCFCTVFTLLHPHPPRSRAILHPLYQRPVFYPTSTFFALPLARVRVHPHLSPSLIKPTTRRFMRSRPPRPLAGRRPTGLRWCNRSGRRRGWRRWLPGRKRRRKREVTRA